MKKRLWIILLFVCMMFVFPNMAFAITGNWSGEDYEAASHYLIYNEDDLFQFANLVNSGYDFEGKTVQLKADLDISGRNWCPIGVAKSSPFRGTFYGEQHTISGLTYSSDQSVSTSGYWSVGLFGYIQGNDCDVRELKLDNVSINVSANAYKRSSLEGVGGIVGTMDGSSDTSGSNNVWDCSVSGQIFVQGDAMTSVGGIVGRTTGPKEGFNPAIGCCNNYATVENPDNTGNTGTGGILGSANVTTSLEESINNARVTGAQNVGGIAGYVYCYKSMTLKSCQNNGTITGEGYTGGIIGIGQNLSISNCTNTGEINCSSSFDVGFGGIIGSLNEASDDFVRGAKITHCNNSGIINASNADGVGGIVGYADGLPYTNNCINRGNIYGNKIVGGIVGTISPNGNGNWDYVYRIEQCENYGDIEGFSIVGGIVGVATGVEIRYANKALIIGNTNHGFINGNTSIGGIIGATETDDSYEVWPIIQDNKNLGKGFIGGAIIGLNDRDGLPSNVEDPYGARKRILHNYWTNVINLPGIAKGPGSESSPSKRVGENGAYDVATGLLDVPYVDDYGRTIISITGQVAPTQPPENPDPEDPQQIVISFNTKGISSEPDDLLVDAGSSFYLPHLDDTEDYHFLGWTANGVNYEPGALVSAYENMIFIARWETVEKDPEPDRVQEVWMYIGDTHYTVDGNIQYLDVQPYIKNNRTYVPIRALAEAFGADVEWNNEYRQVHISLGETFVDMFVDENVYFVNENMHRMDVSPEIVNGRTCLPIRFAAEALGFEVEAQYTTYGTTDSVFFRYVQ